MAWAVTAAGVVSAAGDTPQRVYGALSEGRPLLPTPGPPELPIHDFDPAQYVKRKGLKNFSRTSQLACAAASRLCEAIDGFVPTDVGVVLGSAWASLDSIVRFEREACLEGVRFVDPLLFTETVANVPAGQISIVFGWSALNATVAGGTGAGLAAIHRATEFLDEGRARAVVTGGCDELNVFLLQTLSDEGCIDTGLPFAEDGCGPAGSEGACLFLLESPQGAAGRGAPVLGLVHGAASRFIDPEATAQRCEFLAGFVERAGLSVADIDLVVLSGNGRAERDRAESELMRELFGAQQPTSIAPKSVLGETWAASGPLGLLLAFEIMRAGTIPARPAAMRPAEAHHGLEIPETSIDRNVRNALILDCDESGQLSAVVATAAG